MPIEVVIVPHDPAWAKEFERESVRIREALGDAIARIHHIGSTSIPNIYAKPIIDILIETLNLKLVDERSAAMEALGYEALGEFGLEGRRYFRRDNALNIRTHHVHTFETNTESIHRHLAFRDFMTAHPEYAQRYSELKRDLAPQCAGDMQKYMDGKDPFIKEAEAKALKWWRARNC